MSLASPAAEVTARELAALVIEALNLEDLDPEQLDLAAPLFGDSAGTDTPGRRGLGLDSLDLLELSLVIQQRYGVRLKADDPNNRHIFASLENLARHINSVRTAQG